jgi:CRP-like cAMP-binding protein
LETLPREEAELIRAECATVELRTGQVLADVGKAFGDAYFPVSSVVSVTTQMRDGRLVESTTIGREAVACLPGLLGSKLSRQHVVAQVPGSALAVPVETLRGLLGSLPEFEARLGLMADCMMTAMSQSAACLALHPVPERCARWLLMTADRVDSNSFHLTQEYLAAMLGVHRPTVTIAARTLQLAGLIAYRRGEIQILDRAGLEAASCECYEVVRDVFREFLGGE